MIKNGLIIRNWGEKDLNLLVWVLSKYCLNLNKSIYPNLLKLQQIFMFMLMLVGYEYSYWINIRSRYKNKMFDLLLM